MSAIFIISAKVVGISLCNLCQSMVPCRHPCANQVMACNSMTPSQELRIVLHLVRYSRSVSSSLCLHMENCYGRFGLLYVLVKLLTKTSEKSSQQLMLFSGKLFSQILAGPSNICGIYRRC